MNKKRKILTVVAMVAFGAVVVLHYGTGIHYEGPYRHLHRMTHDGIEFAIGQGNKVVWEDTGADPDYPNPEFRKVLLEHPGRG